MTTKGYTEHEEQIARFAKAMGHPARMAILHFLASQQSCFFGEIHEVLPIAKATVSQHLKELKEAGLIQGEIEAPKVRYCINRSNWLLARDLFAEFSAKDTPTAAPTIRVADSSFFLPQMFVIRRIHTLITIKTNANGDQGIGNGMRRMQGAV